MAQWDAYTNPNTGAIWWYRAGVRRFLHRFFALFGTARLEGSVTRISCMRPAAKSEIRCLDPSEVLSCDGQIRDGEAVGEVY